MLITTPSNREYPLRILNIRYRDQDVVVQLDSSHTFYDWSLPEGVSEDEVEVYLRFIDRRMRLVRGVAPICLKKSVRGVGVWTALTEYHTREACNERISQRKKNPVVLPLFVYYHAALMHGWQAIVEEQFRLFSFVGLRTIYSGVIGDAEALKDMAAAHGINLTVVENSRFLTDYEMPTIRALWQHACRESAAFMYTHTKNVSHPDYAGGNAWRRLMSLYVIVDWQENLKLLSEFDVVGANWHDDIHFPHFHGNFWMARGDWLAHLPDPMTYRDKNLKSRMGGQNFHRMFAEAFIACCPYIHFNSLCCENENWSDASRLYTIPGFTYE
jgi:hypothetical protein